MSLQLGQTAPDFEQDSTQGRIRFHDWLGDSWGILFSHPKDFTPVCTTELGEVARLKPEWDKRNVRAIGLSVDPLEDHQRWRQDIADTQGHALNFPLLADADRKVAELRRLSRTLSRQLSQVRSMRTTTPRPTPRPAVIRGASATPRASAATTVAPSSF